MSSSSREDAFCANGWPGFWINTTVRTWYCWSSREHVANTVDESQDHADRTKCWWSLIMQKLDMSLSPARKWYEMKHKRESSVGDTKHWAEAVPQPHRVFVGSIPTPRTDHYLDHLDPSWPIWKSCAYDIQIIQILRGETHIDYTDPTKVNMCRSNRSYISHHREHEDLDPTDRSHRGKHVWNILIIQIPSDQLCL